MSPCPAAAPESPEFVPLTTAAKAARTTPYSIKTGVLAGLIRAVVVPGFPPRYSRTDSVRVFESLRA